MSKFTETTHRSIAWIKRNSDDGRIILAPPFQRNPVWSQKQQSALIETILLEYPVPEIYMQDNVDANGIEEHIIVDGQQRLRAVLDYISGDYEISEPESRWSGMSFEDLLEADRKKIWEYKFVVRLLPSMPDEQLRIIFQRLNRNTVTLNAQELRHSTYWGAFIKLMESLSDLEFWNVAGLFSANDRRRMLDAEFISEITVAYLNGLQNKKTKLEDYYRIYEVSFDDEEKVKTLFFKVLGEIETVLPELSKTRWRKKSDFYTLFLCFAEKADRLPVSAEQRDQLRLVLTDFGNEVNAIIANEGDEVEGAQPEHNEEPAAENVHRKYARAVQRAASDLGSRRTRRDALMSAIGPLIEPEDAN